jgi:hypothetical protein
MIGVLGAHLAAHAGRKAAHLNPVVKGLLCALILLPMVVAWCLVL